MLGLTTDIHQTGFIYRYMRDRYSNVERLQKEYRDESKQYAIINNYNVPGKGGYIGNSLDFMIKFAINPNGFDYMMNFLLKNERYSHLTEKYYIMAHSTLRTLDYRNFARASTVLKMLSSAYLFPLEPISLTEALDNNRDILIPDEALDSLAEIFKDVHPFLIKNYSDLSKNKLIVYLEDKDFVNCEPDLLYENTLIEFKSNAKTPSFNKEVMFQLLGYFLIDKEDKYGIKKLAIYNTRYSYYREWDPLTLLKEVKNDPNTSIEEEREKFHIMLCERKKIADEKEEERQKHNFAVILSRLNALSEVQLKQEFKDFDQHLEELENNKGNYIPYDEEGNVLIYFYRRHLINSSYFEKLRLHLKH